MGLTSNMVVMMGAVFLTVSGTVWLFVDDVKPTLQWTQQHLQDAAIDPASASQRDEIYPVDPTAWTSSAGAEVMR
jgi:hypothetical protein